MPSAPKTPARRQYFAALGAAIAAGRAEAGLTQEEAAADLDTKLDTYRSWEYGLRECPVEVRLRISERWGVDPQLLNLDGRKRCPTCGHVV